MNIVIAKTNNKNGATECIGRDIWVPCRQDIIAKERKRGLGGMEESKPHLCGLSKAETSKDFFWIIKTRVFQDMKLDT